MMTDFSGKNVIVTGGTGGIGGAITVAFLAAGAHVTAIYGGNQVKAEAFKEANSQYAPLLDIVKVDTADANAVEEFFQSYHQTEKEVAVLVNNAGIRLDNILAMMNFEDWQRVLDVNLTGAFNMAKFAVQSMMRERFGRIINISSPSGKFGFKGQANYAASKAGLEAMTRSLSKEVASRGITVNALSPGFIDTGFIEDLTPEQKKAYKSDIPMRRFGKPEEVAACALFLASDAASYVNGSTLEVTGGL
jgi:3-oxoacyl-[acyl-carrier protein] reductase